METSKLRSIPFTYKFIGSVLIFLCSFFIAMMFGAAETSMKDVWLALTTNDMSDKVSIIRDIRLPREIAAIFVGAALAISGAIMQGVTRNSLADPGLLGLTAGANLALVITIAFIPSANYFSIMIACFVGAAAGAMMVFGISNMKRGGFSPLRLVLAGAAVTAFLQAFSEGITLYFKLSKDVSMWTAGGTGGTTWGQLQIIVPAITIATIIAILFSKQLTVLSLNEEVAIGLGQRIILIKTILFIIVIILAGAAVALAGNLAFVGLMIPHIVRSIVGTDYRFIIPMCATIGAAFMLLADTIGRTINSPYETSIVAVISIVGLPFFLFIVRKGGRTFS